MGSFLSRVTANKHRKAGAEALDAFLPGPPTVHLFYVALQWGLNSQKPFALAVDGLPAREAGKGPTYSLGGWANTIQIQKRKDFQYLVFILIFKMWIEMARIATELNLHNS